MDVQTIEMDRGKALEMYRKYKTHANYSPPVDMEIRRVFDAIAKGRVVVRALASIVAAGVGADGLPRLALARADARTCWFSRHQDHFRMATSNWVNGKTAKNRYFDFPAAAFPSLPARLTRTFASTVPHIPPDIRPKRGKENYHILYEAEWSQVYPKDPMLLRRVGAADLWLVCGAWDLTDIEREVLGARDAPRDA
jgi:hypothetical protein